MSLIELFDAQRLQPRRQWSVAHPALLPLVAVAGAAVWGYSSHAELKQLRAQRLNVDAQLVQLKALSAATQGDASAANRQALLQRAERLEAELAALGSSPGNEAVAMPPSGWLTRLEQLAAPAISLTKVEIDRGGAARIEGMALDAQAISSFVSAWGAHEAMAALPPRTLDVQQAQGANTSAAANAADGAAQGGAPRLLKFVVRAAAWPDGSAARSASANPPSPPLPQGAGSGQAQP